MGNELVEVNRGHGRGVSSAVVLVALGMLMACATVPGANDSPETTIPFGTNTERDTRVSAHDPRCTREWTHLDLKHQGSSWGSNAPGISLQSKRTLIAGSPDDVLFDGDRRWQTKIARGGPSILIETDLVEPGSGGLTSWVGTADVSEMRPFLFWLVSLGAIGTQLIVVAAPGQAPNLMSWEMGSVAVPSIFRDEAVEVFSTMWPDSDGCISVGVGEASDLLPPGDPCPSLCGVTPRGGSPTVPFVEAVR